MKSSAVIVEGARTHNLKDVHCRFPHGQLTVVTGVSGSGKSSLAFETVFQEGQRRYMSTFSTYARQYLDRVKRPPVEAVRHIQPTLALRQWNAVSQPRSTVATVTEVSDFLGLLFAAIGQLACVDCGVAVQADNPSTIAAQLCHDWGGQRVVLLAPLELPDDDDEAGSTVEGLIRDGFGRLYQDGDVVALDEQSLASLRKLDALQIVIDRLRLTDAPHSPRLRDSLEQALALGRGRLSVSLWDAADVRNYFTDLRCNACGRRHAPMTRGLFSFNTPLGACRACNGFGRAMGLAIEAIVPDPQRSLAGGAVEPFQTERGRRHQLVLEQLCRRQEIPIDRAWCRLSREQQGLVFKGDGVSGGVRAFFKALESERYTAAAGTLLARYRRYTTCEACDGTRLSADARAVSLRGRDFGAVSELSIDELLAFVDGLDLNDDEGARAGVLPAEILHRLRLLTRVGVGYLTLDRMTRTLSSGEYQRIQLAGCIGRGLVDTCYILDEPTAGLHARDSERLLGALKALRDLGNTVIVVEHELGIIRGADHIIELGPGGGELGGEVLYEGSLEGLRELTTPTRRMLFDDAPVATTPRRPRQWLTVIGAQAHNLRDVTARFPHGCLTVVSGVSGSGKSTLVFDVLRPAVEEALRGQSVTPRVCLGVEGLGRLGSVIAMHRGRAGLTSRSTVMSYVGVLEPIRKRLAEAPQARERGLTAFHFSVNVKGGRCDACEGMGVQVVDMHFMSDVEIECDSCQGQRFKPNVLAVRHRGLNMADIYGLTVTQALERFRGEPKIERVLGPLVEVGLAYLQLGQPTQTLSGGELQRLRIAEHLVDRRGAGDARPTLFLFDEPSLGLHSADVERLITLFHRLRKEGHTVIAVEHNLEIIAAADWVVDLGPEAGDAGGRLVVEGPPATVAEHPESRTGRCLGEAGLL